MQKNEDLRYKKIPVCKECGECDTTRCAPARGLLRKYDGIRLTSDGFDCALPLTIDSHSICAYGCLYCFSDNLTQHRESYNERKIGQTSLREIELIFSGESNNKTHNIYRKALRYDKRNKFGYPCPVQLGGICDAGDHIERQQGWLLKFLDLSHKYKQPVRMSTKGNIFTLPDYINKVSVNPHLLWVAFSIISTDDELLSKIDERAPSSKERFRTMKLLTDIGVKCSLRFRPILPGISDSTKNRKGIWKEMIYKAKECGASAVSYEVGFFPGVSPSSVKENWNKISKITGIPYKKIYDAFGKYNCTRPPFSWTEEIMHAIKEECQKLGLVVGVSDPVWKQLTDSGCCCGILPTDEVFGNWEVENATNALLIGKETGCEITADMIVPPWSIGTKKQLLCHQGVGPTAVYRTKHETWEMKLLNSWNDLKNTRGPFIYFQGALEPVRKDHNGNLVFKYVGLERQNKRGAYWKV